MRSKKIITGLLMLGVIASSCTLFNQFNVKAAFADNIKQDVVYTKNDTSAVSQNDNDYKLNKETDEAIKQKVLDTCQKYFNESPETFKDWEYGSSVLNENNIDGLKEKELKCIQDEFDKKEISSEEFNKRKDQIIKNDDGLKNNISNKLKHGIIQVTLIDKNSDDLRLAFLNENTKEIEWILGHTDYSATPLTTSDEQLKNIAEDFIKQNKLGDIEKPKFIMFSGKGHRSLFYQDQNDPTKKVEIGIDRSTNKIDTVAIKSYADMFYNEKITENN